MLEGICPKCGVHFFGWSLRFPRNQSCSKCGTALDIYENGELVSRGYSPFTAEKYSLEVSDGGREAEEKEREKGAAPRKKDNNV